jgi:predicted ATPase
VLHVLAVEGYRSLRDLVLPLGRLTVVTGANGSGKSSLYRSLRLLAETARGGAVAALAREGGLASTLWAGPESLGRGVRSGEEPVQGTVRTKAVALRLGFAGDDFGYAIDFGLPQPDARTLFGQDPEIKREAVWSGPVLRPATLLTQRAGQVVSLRDDAGSWVDAGRRLRPGDSMLSEVADPYAAPEVLDVREQVRSWRFYDGFRTDAAAPARGSRVGTSTPVLDPDGADLAAALQTVRELGDGDQLDEVLEQVLPGSRLVKELGETDVADQGRLDRPPWQWPNR